MASKIIPYRYLFPVAVLLLMVTCSIERNTQTTRFYHSLTARYNIYFNGNESFKAGVARIMDTHRDDFAEILNVFEYSDPATVQAGSADMETAIQKASKLISLKSITAKPEIQNKRDISERDKKLLDRKEYNEWVDDSYLLIGKARFYKHEFDEAEAVLNYCIEEANDQDIRTESSIWLARSHAERGDYGEALRIISGVELNEDHSRSLMAMYYTTLADIYVKQKRYSEATEPLSKGLEYVQGKRSRYRLTYLLAQLYEHSGNSLMATNFYRKVTRMNPPYEVEFNARINIAGVFDVSTGDPAGIQKELDKMLRDPKNTRFQDQIYYAMGNLAMREGNESQALSYFRKSAFAGTSNPNQKGRSYLSLADYFYERSDYMDAGLYLDSAVMFLDTNYPGYDELKNRSRNLNELIPNLVIMEREDSLQRLAVMPAEQRNEIISGIIAEVSKAGASGNSTDYTDRYNMGQYYENEQRFQDNIEQEGKWYFYNQAALTFGRTEFRRRWGDRKLEDNWRRSNRTRSGADQSMNDEGDESTTAKKDTITSVLDNKNPEFYLRNLPVNDSLLAISNDKHALAMLNAGKAYMGKLNDTTKAAETFEALISRHPQSVLIPETLYELYRLYEPSNKIKAETYRQRLIERYPATEFAKILSDPDYYRNLREDQLVTEKLYEAAYESYTNEQFEKAIVQINDALAVHPDNPLAPKFMLLHSYVIARTTDERTFREDLGLLIDNFPGTPESEKAKELIAGLDKKMPELKIEEDKIIAAEIYSADTTDTRIFVLVINDPNFNLNQASFDVISYNIDYYTNKNYRTEGSLFENRFLLITVSGFSNFKSAMDYYQKFLSASPVRNGIAAGLKMFVISQANLQKLKEDKDPGRYEIFFRENFLK
ncbi:MAG TPA: tetratricopeptide repeat protein [Bacteroidales bacterium]|nr:tetratricopeptide repeat protein [Bacteroidales bacterium]